MVVLSRVDLSFAYPFISLNFVFVLAGSALLLHEHVPANRFLGAALIILGVLVVSRR
jgi:drug/metabolite transporter (DMT)-like permease